MGDLWISDISHFDQPDGSMPRGRGARKVRFLGEIVSAASLLELGEFQTSAISCRRRPNRRSCTGKIELGRDEEADDIHWRCTACNDRGVITGWRETRWDLSLEVKNGRIVSLSHERARRAGRGTVAQTLRVYELDVELVYAPLSVEERVCRRVRVSGDHTLHQLHEAIHAAFDRVEDEAYEFMFGPPYDPQTRRFTGAAPELEDDEEPFEARQIRLDELDLKPGDAFGYLFDFSDEWVHRVVVRSRKEINGRSVSPLVTQRVGESPPQLPAIGEQWDEDLFWDDVETTYPLTGLYGPYLAEEGVDPEEWLGLDELEQHLLVMEAHTHSLPSDHPPVGAMLLHAVVHVLAETHLAELGPRKARRKLAADDADSRHSAIHRLGEALVREQIRPAPEPNGKGQRRGRSTSRRSST